MALPQGKANEEILRLLTGQKKLAQLALVSSTDDNIKDQAGQLKEIIGELKGIRTNSDWHKRFLQDKHQDDLMAQAKMLEALREQARGINRLRAGMLGAGAGGPGGPGGPNDGKGGGGLPWGDIAAGAAGLYGANKLRKGVQNKLKANKANKPGRVPPRVPPSSKTPGAGLIQRGKDAFKRGLGRTPWGRIFGGGAVVYGAAKSMFDGGPTPSVKPDPNRFKGGATPKVIPFPNQFKGGPTPRVTPNPNLFKGGATPRPGPWKPPVTPGAGLIQRGKDALKKMKPSPWGIAAPFVLGAGSSLLAPSEKTKDGRIRIKGGAEVGKDGTAGEKGRYMLSQAAEGAMWGSMLGKPGMLVGGAVGAVMGGGKLLQGQEQGRNEKALKKHLGALSDTDSDKSHEALLKLRAEIGSAYARKAGRKGTAHIAPYAKKLVALAIPIAKMTEKDWKDLPAKDFVNLSKTLAVLLGAFKKTFIAVDAGLDPKQADQLYVGLLEANDRVMTVMMSDRKKYKGATATTGGDAAMYKQGKEAGPEKAKNFARLITSMERKSASQSAPRANVMGGNEAAEAMFKGQVKPNPSPTNTNPSPATARPNSASKFSAGKWDDPKVVAAHLQAKLDARSKIGMDLANDPELAKRAAFKKEWGVTQAFGKMTGKKGWKEAAEAAGIGLKKGQFGDTHFVKTASEKAAAANKNQIDLARKQLESLQLGGNYLGESKYVSGLKGGAGRRARRKFTDRWDDNVGKKNVLRKLEWLADRGVDIGQFGMSRTQSQADGRLTTKIGGSLTGDSRLAINKLFSSMTMKQHGVTGSLPGYARGTGGKFARGAAIVGENGPELITGAPGGYQVKPMKMMKNIQFQSGGREVIHREKLPDGRRIIKYADGSYEESGAFGKRHYDANGKLRIETSPRVAGLSIRKYFNAKGEMVKKWGSMRMSGLGKSGNVTLTSEGDMRDGKITRGGTGGEWRTKISARGRETEHSPKGHATLTAGYMGGNEEAGIHYQYGKVDARINSSRNVATGKETMSLGGNAEAMGNKNLSRSGILRKISEMAATAKGGGQAAPIVVNAPQSTNISGGGGSSGGPGLQIADNPIGSRNRVMDRKNTQGE
tara:strand:+ start:4804 stop:8112 length:3309 start_codon:yes stop_codon:yes gene_type:complete